MKLSMTNLVVLSMLSLAIVSCGGSKKSSSSDDSSSSSSSSATSGTSSGTAALTTLNEWINGNDTGTYSGNIVVTTQKQSCSTVKVIGINLGTGCSNTTKTYSTYWVKGVVRTYNTRLAEVIADVSGYTRTISQQSGLFTVTLTNDSDSTDVIQYTVNTNLHPFFNPIKVIKVKDKTIESFVTYRI